MQLFLSHDEYIKSGIHSFLGRFEVERDSVEEKQTSLQVVFLGKTLHEIVPSLCDQ